MFPKIFHALEDLQQEFCGNVYLTYLCNVTKQSYLTRNSCIHCRWKYNTYVLLLLLAGKTKMLVTNKRMCVADTVWYRPLFSYVETFSSNIVTSFTVIILNIGTDRSEQTMQTQIRLLLMEQSDQGLLCLLFCLHLLNTILHRKIQLFQL